MVDLVSLPLWVPTWGDGTGVLTCISAYEPLQSVCFPIPYPDLIHEPGRRGSDSVSKGAKGRRKALVVGKSVWDWKGKKWS